MKLVSPVLAETNGAGVRSIWHWCPGCNELHRIALSGDHVNWGFDGNVEAPTLTPSIKHWWRSGEEQTQEVCHYFIKAGQIEFCADCTHKLAGQTLPLPPLSNRKLL